MAAKRKSYPLAENRVLIEETLGGGGGGGGGGGESTVFIVQCGTVWAE
jgi:hypothetical protein